MLCCSEATHSFNLDVADSEVNNKAKKSRTVEQAIDYKDIGRQLNADRGSSRLLFLLNRVFLKSLSKGACIFRLRIQPHLNFIN